MAVMLVSLGCSRPERAGTQASATEVPPAVQWEYVTFAPPDEVYDETLNRLGKEGWELVTARRVRASYGEMAYEITLRRQVMSGRSGTTAEEQMAIALEAARPKRDARLKSEAEALLADVKKTVAASQTAEPPPSAPTPAPKTLDELRAEAAEHHEVFGDRSHSEYHEATCPNVTGRMPVMWRSVAVASGYQPASDCHPPATHK
jgi:hypothetical protein